MKGCPISMALRVVLLLFACVSFGVSFEDDPEPPIFTKANGTLNYAGVITKPGGNIKYKGAGGSYSVHRLTVKRPERNYSRNEPLVTFTQYSSGHLKISNGDDYVQIGWSVNPPALGTAETGLFLYFKSGDTQCFGWDCPGLEVTNRDLINHLFDKVTGGPVYVEDFFISRDNNGAWRASIFQNKTEIGYWPQQIFKSPGLRDLATSVEWGGEVYTQETTEPGPPMGTGLDVEPMTTDNSAFVSNIVVVNEAGAIVKPSATQPHTTSKYYKAVDVGDTGGPFGHLVLYGGRGAP